MSFAYPTHLLPRSHYIHRYEAARSFDIDDDLEFCPGLLTDEETQQIYSSSSDKSSNSSGSPSSSPLQHQIQPTSSPLYNVSPYHQPSYATNKSYSPPQASNGKLGQQTARVRNAIPIVNPTTGMRVSSPPLQSQNNRGGQLSSNLSRRLW